MNALLMDTLNAVAMAIVHFIWQGTLVGLLAWPALALTGNARPQIRYLIACAGLLLCSVLPALQFLLSWTSRPSMLAASSAPAVRAGPEFYHLGESAWYLQSAWLEPALPWILAAWFVGVGLFSLRLMFGLQWIAKARNSALHPADQRLQQLLSGLLPRMGIRQSVSLRLCPKIETPMAMGLLRPLVLFPIGLASHLSTDAVEALLAHELAHVKRQDYLVNLLQRIVETLLFYHPVVWWLSRRIRQEREHIADDLAAEALCSPRRVALALSALSEWQPASPLLANTAHGGQLMNRITRLIKPRHMAFVWKAALPALALTLVCLTVVAKQSMTAITATAASAGASIDSGDDRRDETFAIVKAGTDGMMMSGSTDHIDDIKKIRPRINGDFLWFSRNGEAFVIRDPAVLSKVTAVWQPTEKLSAEMDVLSTQMDGHSRKMDALSVEMDKLSQTMEMPSKAMDDLAQKMQQSAEKSQELAKQMSNASGEAELAELDRRMQSLEIEQQQLERRMQALNSSMAANQEPMERLGELMQTAGRPMEALGGQMETLGKEIEKSSQAAEAQTRVIINEAMAQGKAQPAGKL